MILTWEDSKLMIMSEFVKVKRKFKIYLKISFRPEQAILGCAACRTYLASLIRDRRNGASQESLVASATTMCRIVTPFDTHVCPGLVELNVESLLYIIDARPSLTATNVCAIVLQGECGSIDPDMAFTVNVAPGNPVVQSKSVWAPRQANELRIIHLTDLHYDPHYMTGGIGPCPNPVCCRRADGMASNNADAAGRWGDYRVRTCFDIIH